MHASQRIESQNVEEKTLFSIANTVQTRLIVLRLVIASEITLKVSIELRLNLL